MVKCLLAALVCCWLAACREGAPSMQLYERLEARCPCQGDACIVRLRDVVDFEWDRVVFIRMHAIASQVALALGIARVELPEFEDRILFLDGEEIRLTDSRSYHPEKPYDRTVFLDFSSIDGKFAIIARDAAVFRLECRSSGTLRNMMLVPMPEDGAP
jgi:hypothetical protein